MSKLNLYSIPEDEMLQLREAADLALRGITFRPCTQQPPRQESTIAASESIYGHINDFQTELGEFYSHATK